MNKTLSSVLAGLALGAGVTWFVIHPRAHSAAKTDTPASAAPTGKPNPLRLPPAKREQAGIVLSKPSGIALAPEVEGFARVLDPTAFATAVSEVETARAALNASGKSLERAKKLFAAGGNASAQAVETAEAAEARDRAAFNAAQAKLTATWGREVATRAGSLASALSEGGALVRIDLLPGDTPGATPKQIRLKQAGRDDPLSAEVIGAAPVADAQVAGAGFLALTKESLPIGTALRAIVPGPGEANQVLTIPRRAVVYHQGSAWVFVLGEEDTFERKYVTLGRSAGKDAVVVTSGLEPDEQVVTTGAEQLLAAELQAGGAPEEP